MIGDGHYYFCFSQKTIDIASAFVSTRSGMTRFKTVDDNDIDNKTDNDLFSRSIDEVYYRRAVDFYYNDSKAFVYSIPFEAGYKEPNFLVTASHAIFVGSGKMSAPGMIFFLFKSNIK